MTSYGCPRGGEPTVSKLIIRPVPTIDTIENIPPPPPPIANKSSNSNSSTSHVEVVKGYEFVKPAVKALMTAATKDVQHVSKVEKPLPAAPVVKATPTTKPAPMQRTISPPPPQNEMMPELEADDVVPVNTDFSENEPVMMMEQTRSSSPMIMPKGKRCHVQHKPTKSKPAPKPQLVQPTMIHPHDWIYSILDSIVDRHLTSCQDKATRLGLILFQQKLSQKFSESVVTEGQLTVLRAKIKEMKAKRTV